MEKENYKPRLGEALLEAGVVSETDLEVALRMQEKGGKRLGEILLDKGLIDEKQLLAALSRHLDIPLINLKNCAPSPELIAKVDFRYANHYKLIPVSISNGCLTVAVSEPPDVQTLDDLTMLFGLSVQPVLAPNSEIQEAIRLAYGVGADTISSIMDIDTAASKKREEKLRSVENIAELTDQASIIRFVNQIFVEAFQSRATDLHLEPFADELRIRYRVDGVLYQLPVPTNLRYFHQEIVSRIKVMSNLNIAEKRLPQDGRCKVKIADTELDLRISILPSAYGETVSVRFLDQSSILYGLDKLGISPDYQVLLESIIRKPHGILLVTGPTGSGKTTTLYSCLSKINDSQKKIITIEDPIEYQLHGVSQIQVHPKVGLSFDRGLRSMLRHDPDVMMVGEIRDSETAKVAVQVALTGHLVLSSLHTNDAASAVDRLRNMGVEPYLIASTLECIVAQRLVRLVCHHCRDLKDISTQVPNGIADLNGDMLPRKVYVSVGCVECNFTGYMGRTGLFEIMVVSDTLREAVLKKAPVTSLKKLALESGMRTLRQDGIDKVKQGLTTIEEVLRVTQEAN